MSLLTETLARNHRHADNLLHFLQSNDPGAKLSEDIREPMLITCRTISNNTSIQNIPLQPFARRVPLQLPLTKAHLAAVLRDEGKLRRMTDQLRLHAYSLLDEQAQHVWQQTLTLEAQCQGAHATMSTLAKRFVQLTVPNVKNSSHDAPHIAGEMLFAKQLLTRIDQLKTAYRQIHTGYQKVAAYIPMEQDTCDSLVQPLKRAQHFADQLSMDDCKRSLLQFDVRFMLMKVAHPLQNGK